MASPERTRDGQATSRPSPDLPSPRSLISTSTRTEELKKENFSERLTEGESGRDEAKESLQKEASSLRVTLDGQSRRIEEAAKSGPPARSRNEERREKGGEEGRGDARRRRDEDRRERAPHRDHGRSRERERRRDGSREREKEREKDMRRDERHRERHDERHGRHHRDTRDRKGEHSRRHERPRADYPPSKRARYSHSRSPRRDRGRSDDRHGRSEGRRSRSRSPQLYRKERTYGSIYEYELVGSINEGSFGTVFHALNKNKEHVAVKRLKLEPHDEKHGIYEREIDALENCEHENIIKLIELCTNQKSEKFLVLEYCRYDLRKLLRIHPRLDTPLIKNFVLQILRGLEYLHSKQIIHRDLKSENLLINDHGVLKLGDLGSCRTWRPTGSFSPNMVTLRYRALELFLGAKRYSTAVDMWSLGCIMAELYAGTGKPFLDGTSELEQIDKMCEVLGSPSEKKWPGLNRLEISRKLTFPNQPLNKLRQFIPSLDDEAFLLVSLLLRYNPETRISAKEAIAHAYFRTAPLPAPVGSLPENITADIERKNAMADY